MDFEITIQGRGGHGSRPDCSRNPIDCFAAIFGALLQLGCKISCVDAGTCANIIPDALRFRVTVAGEKTDAMKQMVEHTCSIYHCSPNFHTP